MRAWSLAILLGTAAIPALAQTPGTHGLFDSGAGANPGIGGGTVALPTPGQANGYAGLDGSALLPIANLPAVPVAKLPVGVASGTVLAGNDAGLATAESKAGTALQSGTPVSVTASATLNSGQCGETLVDQAAAAIILTVPAGGALPLGCTIGVFQASPAADTATIAFASGMGGVYSGTANVTGGLGLGLTLKVLTSSATGVIASGGLLR